MTGWEWHGKTAPTETNAGKPNGDQYGDGLPWTKREIWYLI